MFLARALIGCSCVLLLVSPLGAAEPDPAEVEPEAQPPRHEVVVTVTASEEPAAELPASVEVIDRADLESRRAVSLAERLGEVPGVTVATSGGAGAASSMFSRGTNSNHTLVLRNGVQLNDPGAGGYDWSHLSPDGVERIEVVRGPFSALYGADALGGVVNILTAPGDPGLSGSFTLEAGEDSYRRGSAALAGGGGPVRYRLSYSDRDGRGDLDGWGGVAHEHYGLRSAGADLDVDLGDRLELSVAASWWESELAIPFASGVGSEPRANRSQRSSETTLAVPLRGRIDDRWTWELTLSRVEGELRFEDPDDLWTVATRVDTSRSTLRHVHRLDLGNHDWSAGVDLSRRESDAMDRSPSDWDGDGRADESRYQRDDQVVGLFLQDVWRPDDRYLIQIGLRHDDNDSYGRTTSPRIAATRLWRDGMDRVHVAYGESFRAPSMGELYHPTYGRPDLEAETGRSLEIGVRHMFQLSSSAHGSVELIVHRTEISELIQFDLATFELGNVGDARTEGMELSLKGGLGDRFSARLGYGLLRAEDRDTRQELLRRPRHSASAWLHYRALEWLDFGLSARFVGRRPDVDNLTFVRLENGSHVDLDLAISGQFRGVEPFLRVENLLDEEYEDVYGYPAAGREVAVGVKASFER